MELKRGDSINLMAALPDNSVDLILTDPPYKKESIYLYDELAREANRILKPHKMLITYVGNYFLYEVARILGNHLDYFWTFVLKHQEGGAAMMWDRRIQNSFKPILAFCKDGFEQKTPIIPDMIKGEGRSKRFHEWQQGVRELYPLIRKFTKTSEVILDPFMGSGTTGVAALQMKRDFIGYEIDEHHFEVASKRLSNEHLQERFEVELA